MFKEDVDKQNDLEETNVEAHLRSLDKLTIQNTISAKRVGEFQIKVVGDPYAGFAKGPLDRF